MANNRVYLTGNEPLIADIARAAFPHYAGRMFKLETAETVDCASAWSGGSRDYFRFVRLADMAATDEVPAQSAFDAPIRGINRVQLPDGIACVVNTIASGKRLGLTIIVNAATMNPAMLPAAVELADDERIVLCYTRRLKAHYGGLSRADRAGQDTGITAARWEAARATLADRKLLNRAGAITPDGRNAIGDWKPAGVYGL